VAASNLKARRPPWSAPNHADNSRPGLKNAASRRIRLVRVFKRCHAAGLSSDPRAHGHCTAARLLQPPQAITTPPQHTLLLANRLAQVSNERARLETRIEIEAIVAKETLENPSHPRENSRVSAGAD
jgi:hypothetical protein